MEVNEVGLLAISIGYFVFGLFSKTSRWGAFTASGYFFGGAVLVHNFGANAGLLLGWTALAVLVWFAGVWRKNKPADASMDLARARKTTALGIFFPLITTGAVAMLDREHWLAYVMLGGISSLGSLRSYLVIARASREQIAADRES